MQPLTDDNDPFLSAGKEQGEIIARYLIARIREAKLTPDEAVNVAATHVKRQAEEMLSSGTSRAAVLRWLRALSAVVIEHLDAFAQPKL